MEKSAIIVAGGVGKRMGVTIPKQFIRVQGKTIIEHTLDRFLSYDASINLVVVIHADYISEWKKIKSSRPEYTNIIETLGGATRFDSVKNGLGILSEHQGIVGVHDAARPLISVDLLTRCFDAVQKKGNAIPCMPSVESLRLLEGNNNSILDRSKVVRIQTPQCFNLKDLIQAYDQKNQDHFTDDASVFESFGHQIHLVEGEDQNIKITSPKDLDFFKFILGQ